MASVVNDPNGRKRIQFFGADGKRYTVRLGRATKKQAKKAKEQIEHLVAAEIIGSPPNDEVSRWVAGLDDVLHARLARTGLIAPRESSQFGAWLDKYLAGRQDLKPESRRKLGQTIAKLKDFFPPDTPLRKITPDQAADWRQWLVNQGLSEASVKTHSGNVKTIFTEAERRRLVPESPFKYLKSGPTASRNDRYITPEETAVILEACPTSELRLLFGLARLAGLRTPSETHTLTWGDVDWERARLNVRCVKTEHHGGHEQREVPITPRLMQLLQDRFDEVEPGQEHLVKRMVGGHLRKTFKAIIQRAGVKPWRGLWQTLRASCEKEWAMTFPQYAVSKWIGHSITISGKHYANAVPDELFEKAAHEAAQKNVVSGRKEAQAEQNGPQEPAKTAPGCTHLQEVNGGGGIRTPETLARLTDFKSVAFSRSATPPESSYPARASRLALILNSVSDRPGRSNGRLAHAR